MVSVDDSNSAIRAFRVRPFARVFVRFFPVGEATGSDWAIASESEKVYWLAIC